MAQPLTMYIPFFFLMIRRPPRSTLFPSRRSSDLRIQVEDRPLALVQLQLRRRLGHELAANACSIANRSEEHTSELQSHSDLVCRLLLEKKKKTKLHKRQQHAFTRLAAQPAPTLTR